MTRRELLKTVSLAVGATALGGCEKVPTDAPATPSAGGAKASHRNEEYVWLSASTNLALFTRHDHPALHLAAEELGVKVSIAGPSSIDIPGLVAAIEQTTARKPAGMMVVGWDPSALVPSINAAVAAGIFQGAGDLVGMAGFDSESGPGMAQAIKEAGVSPIASNYHTGTFTVTRETVDYFLGGE